MKRALVCDAGSDFHRIGAAQLDRRNAARVAPAAEADDPRIIPEARDTDGHDQRLVAYPRNFAIGRGRPFWTAREKAGRPLVGCI
jgi:hypothetical protein